MNVHRKFGFGNLRPALTRNSEEAEPFQTISQNRAGKSIGFIFVLHDNDTKNVTYRAKLPRVHEESVENDYIWGTTFVSQYFYVLHLIYVFGPQIHGQLQHSMVPLRFRAVTNVYYWSVWTAGNECGGETVEHTWFEDQARGVTEQGSGGQQACTGHISSTEAAGNRRMSSSDWAYMERVSGARRERGAAKIEHRVARNERTWGGDQARERRVRSTRASAIERVSSAYGAGVVGMGGGASGE
ncbi:hypothetical protein B0H14DRAFT_2557226 [Mycena olivaceomarginata]|nr:hypothetical protein B0H14DRAFT_2557226 [Mycena olivaceomarginata]